MLRNFTNLVNETVDEAYENGINLFLETLENDLEKDLYINNTGLENTLNEVFSSESEEGLTESKDDGIKTIDE